MSTILSDQARSGRLMVLIATAVTIVGDLIVILLTMPRTLPPERIVGAVIRLLIEASLFYAIWRGQIWARWLIVGLLTIALLLTIPQVLKTMNPLMIGICLQFAIGVGLLSFPPSVGIFLGFQRRLHAKSA